MANVWGTLLNTNFSLIDTAIAGILTLDVSGNSNVVLTTANGAADQARNAMFILTGTLTGNINVLWPNASSAIFSVVNSTTGAFTLSLGANNGSGAPAGAVQVINQDAAGSFYSTGTDVGARAPGTSVGGDLAGTLPNPTVVATHLSAPLPIAQGGTGQTTAAAALTALGYVQPQLRSQVISSSSNFTVPAGATTATIFKFTIVGGGGGGSGSGAGTNGGTSGSSGAVGVVEYSGFTPSTNVTIAIGTAGSAGGTAGAGGSGGSTTLTYNAVTVATATGGFAPAGYQAAAGAVGSFTASAGGSGLTLVASTIMGAQPGANGWNGLGTGNRGGGNAMGQGGIGGTRTPTSPTAGNFGAGGGSAADGAGASGAAGGAGLVVVEWVL